MLEQSLAGVGDLFRRQAWLAPVLAFVAGLLIGLVVLGWWLLPVQWVDADVIHLRRDLQHDYVRLVAANYGQNRDVQLAQRRLAGFGQSLNQVMAETIQTAPEVERTVIQDLQTQLISLGLGGPTAEPGANPGAPTGGDGGSSFIIYIVGLFLVLIMLALGAYVFTRLRQPPSVASTAPVAGGRRSPYVAPVAGPVGYDQGDEQPADSGAAPTLSGGPLARFMTTYTLGDDVYDDSFSIDGPDGNFLGECGMGLSETIGVGDPKKVMAFEVWLFDKNDIRTVTKVVMSEHAYRDEALKSRLAAKGEPVVAQPGDTLTLETATLVVTARIVDMAYGGGALPPSSFFERMTIELQAYRKA
jgi:hypothetical protein